MFMACADLDDQGQRVDASAVAELLSRIKFRVVLDRLKQQQQLQSSNQLDGMSRQRMRALYRFRQEDEVENPEDSALAAIGGYTKLIQIAGEFAPSSNLERYAQLIWDYYLKRRYKQSLHELADKAYMTGDNFSDLLAESSQVVLELGANDKTGAIMHVDTVVDQTLELIGEAFNDPSVGIKTGFHDIDEVLMSLRPGGLYIMAARPGVGKTSFALNVVENIATSGEGNDGVLFFSLEVDATDLIKKLISSRAQVSFKKMEMGSCNEEEFQALCDAGNEISQWNLDLMDISDLNIAQLRSHSRRHQLESQGALKCIVIDYLQLLQASRPTMSEYEKVSEISRTLKILAKEIKVPIIALSQVNRESDKNAGKPRPPRLSDLRGSGSIEQDADAVIFLHNNTDPEEEEQQQQSAQAKTTQRDMQVIVAKNRFGPTASVDMFFFPESQRFKQVAFADEDVKYDVEKQPTVPATESSEDLFDFPAS
ncbi:MAG: AAA family ATPase [Planctomycetes bacterium]|nr:AAA family ATPase [Planctomycetota bacterium]